MMHLKLLPLLLSITLALPGYTFPATESYAALAKRCTIDSESTPSGNQCWSSGCGIVENCDGNGGSANGTDGGSQVYTDSNGNEYVNNNGDGSSDVVSGDGSSVSVSGGGSTITNNNDGGGTHNNNNDGGGTHNNNN